MDAERAGLAMDRQRWWGLVAISLGALIVLLDATIVYVAMPSIRQDLKLTDTSLVWIVNAYTLALSSVLILGGRLGDLYDHRRLLLLGLMLFAIGSLACGLAKTLTFLIAGRVVQGASGAIVAAVTLPLVMDIFPDPGRRAKALGFIGFVGVSGSSLGLLLGGLLTSTLDWHWIFLVNVPIEVGIYIACRLWLPDAQRQPPSAPLDVWGAVTVTVALVLAVYAVLNGNEVGWSSTQIRGLLACALASLVGFLVVESRVKEPLIPLRFFRQPSVIVSNSIRVLWAVGTSTSLFAALYVQLVLGYGPMEVGLTFLPGSVILAACSLRLSPRLVTRFGIGTPLTAGLLLCVVGLMLFARLPVHGQIVRDVIPATILLALSSGMASLPLSFATVSGVTAREAGLASGVGATVGLMSSTLSLAILASVVSMRTNELLASGASNVVALTGGYRLAFLVGAAAVAAAALISATCMPRVMVYSKQRENVDISISKGD